MLKIIEQALIDKQCAIRLGAPEGGKFAVAAIAGNGVALAAGFGDTLEEAVRDMLVDLGMLEEETCTAIA